MSNDSSTNSDCTDVKASSAYNAIRCLANGLNIDLRRLPGGTTSKDASGVLLEGGWCICLELGRRTLFFSSTLLRCDLHKKKIPGRTSYSQHIMIRNET